MRLVDVEPGDPRLSAEILPVLQQLRPQLTAESFAAIYAEGFASGLRFLAAYDGDACVGVAGWRIWAKTFGGRELYVDDLVTDEARRSTGVGAALLGELEQRARAAGCTVLALDSGVHRAGAHRFYFREGMSIVSYRFSKPLT